MLATTMKFQRTSEALSEAGVAFVKEANLNRGYLFFSVKDRNLFHRVDTIGNIFMSGAATRENITDGVHEMK